MNKESEVVKISEGTGNVKTKVVRGVQKVAVELNVAVIVGCGSMREPGVERQRGREEDASGRLIAILF